MKQKDLALIIVIVAVSALVSFFVSRLLFSSPQKRNLTVEVVDPISSNFSTPSSKYFNSKSVDPTQLIQIGNSNNTNPFNGQAQ